MTSLSTANLSRTERSGDPIPWILVAVTVLLAALWGVNFARLPPVPRWIFAAAPVFLLLTFHRPWVAAWSLLALYPSSHLSPAVVALYNYGLPALAMLAILSHNAVGACIKLSLPRNIAVWFLVYWSWTTLSAFFALDPTQAFGESIRILILALALAALSGTWDGSRIRWLIALFLAQLVPSAVVALYQVLIPGIGETLFYYGTTPLRAQGLYQHPNALGFMMGHGVLLLTGWLMAGRTSPPVTGQKFRRAGAFALLLLFSAALIASFSRGALIYVTIGLMVLASLRTWGKVLAVAAVLAVVAVFLAPLPLWMQAILRLDQGASFRPELALAAWRMMSDHPLTGIGAGSTIFEGLRSAYMDTPAIRELVMIETGGAHNIIMNKGAQLGWPGLALVLGLFLMVLAKVGSGLRRLQQGDWIAGACAAVVAGLAVHGLFEIWSTLGNAKLHGSFMFFFAALYLIRRGPESASGGDTPDTSP